MIVICHQRGFGPYLPCEDGARAFSRRSSGLLQPLPYAYAAQAARRHPIEARSQSVGVVLYNRSMRDRKPSHRSVERVKVWSIDGYQSQAARS